VSRNLTPLFARGIIRHFPFPGLRAAATRKNDSNLRTGVQLALRVDLCRCTGWMRGQMAHGGAPLPAADVIFVFRSSLPPVQKRLVFWLGLRIRSVGKPARESGKQSRRLGIHFVGEEEYDREILVHKGVSDGASSSSSRSCRGQRAGCDGGGMGDTAGGQSKSRNCHFPRSTIHLMPTTGRGIGVMCLPCCAKRSGGSMLGRVFPCARALTEPAGWVPTTVQEPTKNG
jgi:hypothetical protein